MKLKVYAIDLDLSPRQKKVIRAAVVTGAVIGALGIGLAVAAPHQWKTSDSLTATDLNSLNVVSYVAADGGTSQYSVGATKFCGSTSGTYTGASAGGPAGVKKACELNCGTPTAHMCTGEEIGRSKTLGIPVTFTGSYAWYSTSAYLQYTNGAGTYYRQTDCDSWNSASGSILGPVWYTGTWDGPNNAWCSASYPILCCD